MSRTAEDIRDAFLESLQTEFTAIGERVVTAPKTPFYALGTALGLEIEGAEAEASAARQEIFPDTASEDGVLSHADFSGLTRVTASRSVLRVRVTGTPSSTGTVPASKTLTSPTGLVFNATAGNVAFDGSGVGYTTVTARDAGAAGNLAVGTTLTWQNGAPSGFGATAVTALASGDTSHLLVIGADLESIEDLRVRVSLERKERAQGGNRAEWVSWATAVEGVGDAFAYPRAWLSGITYRVDVPGTVVLVVLAPSPASDSYVQNADGTVGLGLSPSYSRLPTDALRERVRNYIEGTHDAAGLAVPTALQKQKRPVGVAAANYTIPGYAGAFPTFTEVDVTVRVATDPAVAPWPWGVDDASSRTIVSATSTTLTLDDATGITAGTRLAVELGVSVVRGAFWLARVQGVAGNVVTLTAPLPTTPVSGEVRPDCGLWTDIRRIVLSVFDHLGSGDESTVESQRYPRPADLGQDRLFTSRIIDPAQELAGVAGVSVSTPASPVTPSSSSPLLMLVPRKIRVIRQP